MEKISIIKKHGKWLVNNKQYPELSPEETFFFDEFLRVMKIGYENFIQPKTTTMKNLILIAMLLISSLCFSQKHFVRSENSKHKVSINEEGTALNFDGRTYFIDSKTGWYQSKNDSIVWIYGHDIKRFKDVVKVGFYNNYKNYVVSTKTEKLP